MATQVLLEDGEKLLPEFEPEIQIKGAFLILVATIRILAEDTDLIKDLEPELSKLERIAFT